MITPPPPLRRNRSSTGSGKSNGQANRRTLLARKSLLMTFAFVSVWFCGWMLLATTTVTNGSSVQQELLQHYFTRANGTSVELGQNASQKPKRTASTRGVFRQLPKNNLPPPFDFLSNPSLVQDILHRSDIVELEHCNLQAVTNWTNFCEWSLPILQQTTHDIVHSKEFYPYFSNSSGLLTRRLQQEFLLELLEIYVTHKGYCDFTKFHPTLPRDTPDPEAVEQSLLKVSKQPYNDTRYARLAIVIVAYKDIDHLKRLVEALYMPHHYIIIHLERQTPPLFEAQVQDWITQQQYDNVVLVKFGTIAYRTDSISRINYQIMSWLVHDLQLNYDYHVSIGGAVYPLGQAQEVALYLKRNSKKKSVWLGQLTNAGILGDNTTFHDVRLQRKRLVFTLGHDVNIKPIKRFSSQLVKSHGFDPIIPQEIHNAMVYKTNSGNQAVYSRHVVQLLTSTRQVLELFALAKYGCCCCIEERSWIAALELIGFKNEALQQGAMWQVWGGNTECGSSMNNAILDASSSTCFLVEDASRGSNRVPNEPFYIHANETLDQLKRAKQRGFLFARKFSSTHAGSMELLNDIRTKLRNQFQPPDFTDPKRISPNAAKTGR